MVSQEISAQTISFDFGFYPNKEITVCLKKGIVCDTIYTGTLDEKGTAEVLLPEKELGYKGMAAVRVGDRQLDFIAAPGESPSIRCSQQYPHGGNTIFENSPENQSLQQYYTSQASRLQKIALLTVTERAYDKTDAFVPLLQNEKRQLLDAQSAFEKELSESPLYASRFIRLHNFLSMDVAALAYADSSQMISARRHVQDSLDINNLFTSGLWFATLNGLLALYDKGTPYHEYFVSDMILLLERADSDTIYTTLAENLFAICESMSWNDLEEQLAYHLIDKGRISHPTGKLRLLMTLFKLKKGSKAPLLSQGKLPKQNHLLVFYETGCGNCEKEMQQLKENYPLLKEKGYEIVSVSADVSEQTHQETASSFPWKNKFCDLKGFSSPDFDNYGVIGTPTIYVIDKNGVIQGRYARLQDTGII